MRRYPLLLLLALLGALPASAGIKDVDVDATGPKFTYREICVNLCAVQCTTDKTQVTLTAYSKWQLLNVYAAARARAGAAGDASIDVFDDGVSVLSANCDLDAAATKVDCDLVGSTLPVTIASGSVIGIAWDRTNSGTGDDITVCLVYRSAVAAE